MPDYTIANLREIEDVAVGYGLSPDLEARFVTDAVEATVTGLSYQRLAPGFRSPFGHRQKTQEELYVVLAGGGRMKLDDEIREIRQWDVVRVAPEVMRAFEAGRDGLELIAVGAPRTGPGDGETVPGWWTDGDPEPIDEGAR